MALQAPMLRLPARLSRPRSSTGFDGQGYVDRIGEEKDACVIAVVGSGMKGTPGVAARIFTAVAKRKVNVRMVAQGSSEYNVSFVVSHTDGPEAVRAIHEEFNLGS